MLRMALPFMRDNGKCQMPNAKCQMTKFDHFCHFAFAI
jgi:hypothetical protein